MPAITLSSSLFTPRPAIFSKPFSSPKISNLQTLFDVFDEYLRNERDGAELTVYGQQQRLTPASRTASNWTNVEIVWDETESVFREWLSELKKIHQALEDLGETDDDLAEISDILNELTRNIDEVKSL